MPTLAGALGQPYQQRCRQHCLRDRIPFPKGPDKNGILQKGAASSISPPPFICTDWKKYTAPCLTERCEQQLSENNRLITGGS